MEWPDFIVVSAYFAFPPIAFPRMLDLVIGFIQAMKIFPKEAEKCQRFGQAVSGIPYKYALEDHGKQDRGGCSDMVAEGSRRLGSRVLLPRRS